MEVYEHLETVLSSPSDSILEVLELPLDVRLARANLKCPVSDGNPNMVQAVARVSRGRW